MARKQHMYRNFTKHLTFLVVTVLVRNFVYKHVKAWLYGVFYQLVRGCGCVCVWCVCCTYVLVVVIAEDENGYSYWKERSTVMIQRSKSPRRI